MIRSIVTILGQPRIYLLIIKGQMMGNFLENLGLGVGARIWNKLPKDLKILKSYSQFKKSARINTVKKEQNFCINIELIKRLYLSVIS